jgi:hypothetical protein
MTIHQKRLSGFNSGEFSCPICKSINNCLVPIFSLSEIAKEVESLQGNYADSEEAPLQFFIDDVGKKVLDFFTEYLSLIIKTQTGYICKKDFAGDNGPQEYSKLQLQILLRDIKSNPERVVSQSSNFFVHNINLIDVKGGLSYIKNEYNLD